MSKSEPSVASILSKANDVRELKATETVTLGNGTQHTYTIETESDSPAELAAFERLEAKKQAELAERIRRYEERPVEIPPAMEAYQSKQKADMAAYREELKASREAQDRAEASPSPKPHSAPAAPILPAAPLKPENTISQRWAEHARQMTGGEWSSTRTPKANERMFRTFMDWWKHDGDLSTITREVINRYVTFLTVEQVVEAGNRRGEKGLTLETAKNYISVLNKFLEWAQNKDYYPDDRRLPTADQIVVKKKTRKKSALKANPCHTIGQLQTLFDPKNFHPNEAHHFWPPLIALFTGARRREVAQLLLSDFFTRDGIQAMSINILEDEDKSVKSLAAIRTIPVHPTLIELGLLDYLADVKALALGPEVFPGIGINNNGEKGNAIGNFWREHMKRVKLFNSRSPTFHSFRSTALQEMKDRGVPFEMRCQLAGHEIEHVSGSYNPNPFSLKTLMEEGIPKLVYEHLDLSGLKCKPGQFDVANRISTKARIKREKVMLQKLADKAAKEQEEAAKVASSAMGK